MLRVRLTGALVTFGLLIGGGAALRGTAEGTPAVSTVSASRSAVLQILYTPPILVPAGERVRVPVDVICANAAGRACAASVTFGVRAGAERWRTATVAAAAKGLQFDVTAAAARAAGMGGVGRVEFFIRASGATGGETSLGSPVQPMAFYVIDHLARVPVSGPSGRQAEGHTVLALPWGSGPNRAGLQAGPEAATLGSSSFDVDSRGRIHLVDALQRRVATFDHGHVTGQIALDAGSPADVAVAPDGTTFLAQRADGQVTLRTIAAGGRASSMSMGQGVLSQVRTSGNDPVVDLLPLGMWASPPRPGGSEIVTAGRPLSDGTHLLCVVSGRSIRIARLAGDRLIGAVELTSNRPFGAVPLVEPDGRGGYVVAFRVAGGTGAMDLYRIVHVAGGAVRDSFDTPATSFAAGLPFSRFRLAGGHLFQLTGDERGLRIIRYRLRAVAR